MAYQSTNPTNGKLLQSFEHMSPVQLEQALAQAQSGFETWKRKSYAERAAIVKQAAS